MEKENYYQTLGLPKNSSIIDIRRAYYHLAVKWHPVNTIYFLYFI